ncbi:putative SnoaL-like aldol condensation-catalyzing enzyme [Larkinella arboricola]|uniref:Putative SnoaL-like aldol condensation-catalyzing enzyme n=1 Tax=Larkinella arboricola TaxID=643671 RepID=A0A327X9B8_LARAB|nr:ester cyclase [Larkinella arboricola]RAK02252.1 putative SnoaL-like aldol condensation-catalyzing enzyme [Larkinella arboricola]
MQTPAANRMIVADFIEEIWNKNRLEALDAYLAPDFVDHSLPEALPANREGLKQWIRATSQAFEHKTVLEEQVTEGDTCIVKFRLLARHTGSWRGIQPTGTEASVVGYRCFKLKNGKISQHWALLDGNSLENQLRTSTHGCKVQQ